MKLFGNTLTQRLPARSQGLSARMARPSRAPRLRVRAEAAEDNRASPFSSATVHRSIGEGIVQKQEMNLETVNKALETVRPYILADGGDVEVVEINAGRIFLKLHGNCSSCAASDATLKMGIERALRTTFGDQLVEVVQVKDSPADGPTATTADLLNMHLNMLRGAVSAYGGSIEVVKVAPPLAQLRYEGPEGIGKGIQAAIKAQFLDIKQVEFI